MSDDFVQSLFSEERRWQSWLDVEAALARVQARAGMIPQWAAAEICAAAHLDRLDLPALRAEIERTMAPVHALARALTAASGDAGGWVHWGATTQNIIDTGRILVLREALETLETRLADVLLVLADLAETHADTPMVGRTNRQHALPITFGFKVAGWIDELIRVCQQLKETEARLLQLRFGGAIGAYQSFGAAGPALVRALAAELGLAPSLHQGRAQIDPFIDLVTRLAMLGVAAGRIGSDIYGGMQTEVAEWAEGLGHDVIGSSTMPHKVNPKLVVTLAADASRLRSKGAAAFAVTPPAHEGDAVTNRELRALVEDSMKLALTVADNLAKTLDTLVVNREAMKAQLLASGDQTSLETIMMHLAPKLGRSATHDMLHTIADEARATKRPLQDLLLAAPDITAALEPARLKVLLDPIRNTGQSATIARQLAAAGRAYALPRGSSSGASTMDAASVGSVARMP